MHLIKRILFYSRIILFLSIYLASIKPFYTEKTILKHKLTQAFIKNYESRTRLLKLTIKKRLIIDII
jgi:hypothetical protein